MKYKLKNDIVIRGELYAEAGVIVFDLLKYDYGLASDDTRMTGIPHVSVTLNVNGDYPSFTVPVSDLEKIK